MAELIMKDLIIDDPNYIRENSSFLIKSCQERLEKGEIKIVNVVDSLQTTLTHIDASERALGTQFLVDVLRSPASSERVNKDELKFLISFFVDRLKDHHTVVPHVIVGFLTLIRHDGISSEDVKSLIQGLYKEVHCQSQVMSDRRNIYNLLKYCVLNKALEVKAMGDSFILGFIAAMEGEKDPRNLLLLFSLIPYITTLIPLTTFAEDMFEVIAAYFPIDFSPPKNDPYGISPDDLTINLRMCLSSTDAFAPYCIPLIQEKLESDVVAAKIEALRTLKECCTVYSGESLRTHTVPLWMSLRREIVSGLTEEAETAALDALTSIVAALERGPSSLAARDSLVQLGSSAINECLPHLSSPEQRMMFPSSRLLLALTADSPLLTKNVCEKVLPLLVEQFSSKPEPAGRKNTLIILSKFVSQGSKYRLYDQDPFSSFLDSSFEDLIQGLSCVDAVIREASLCALYSTAEAYSEKQFGKASFILSDIAVGDRDENLRNLAGKSLECFGAKSPSILTSQIIPNLIKLLPSQETKIHNEKVKPILEALSAVCGSLEGVKLVFSFLWEKVEVSLQEESFSLVLLYLSCVQKISEKVKDDGECLSYLCQDWRMIWKCQDLAIDCLVSGASEDPIPILERISSISQSVIHDESNQNIESLVEALLDLNHSHLAEDLAQWREKISLILSTPKKHLIVYCLQGLLLNSSMSVELINVDVFLDQIRRCSLEADDERCREAAAVLCASHLMNIPSEVELDFFLRPLEEEFSARFQSSPKSDSITSSTGSTSMASSVVLLGWIVKALVMRAYSGDQSWINKLEELLVRDETGKSACCCYAFILKDVPSLSCSRGVPRKSYKMLYRQRFFERRIDGMIQQFKEFEGSSKMNIMLAISHLLPCLPQAVLKGHLQKLLPVICQGLSTSDGIVVSGAVGTLSTLLRHNVEDVKSHVSTLLTPLLKLAVSGTLDVRVKSLESVEALTQLPPTTLMPLKMQVLRELKAPLDDMKRVVRQAASNARCAWVLI